MRSSVRVISTKPFLISVNNKDLYLPTLQQGMKRYFGALEPEVSDALLRELEWVELMSGEQLIGAGEAADGMYLLLSGRLSVFLPKEGGREELVGSVFKGETVGEMALLTDAERSATVKASRDSILVKIKKEDFVKIYNKYPSILSGFSKLIISRLQHANQRQVLRLKPNAALLPLHPIADYATLVSQISEAVGSLEQNFVISEQSLADALHIGMEQLESADAQSPIQQYLAELDNRDAYLLFQAQPVLSAWTQRCIRQADVIYLLAEADHAEPRQDLLDYLKERKERHPEVQVHLVLIHPHEQRFPQHTQKWLERVEPMRCYHLRREHHRDIMRLARFITGKTIGIACGGGGAKGLAHIGVFKAFFELGIEVDLIGGTSIGSILGATKAMDWTLEELMAACRKTFIEGSIANDYHFPFFSLLKGRKKEKVLQELFDYQIEDMWYPFLCVSCDLSTNEMLVHERGSLWQAIAASSALPGVFPPLIVDGHFLVDGALINNLPGDLLRARDCDFLISVDVSTTQEIFTNQSAFPPNSLVFRDRLLGRRKRATKFPSLFQIFMRSSYLASTTHAQQISAQSDICLKPPVKRIGLMGWDKMEQAVEAGYQHTIKYFESQPQHLQLLKLRQGRSA